LVAPLVAAFRLVLGLGATLANVAQMNPNPDHNPDHRPLGQGQPTGPLSGVRVLDLSSVIMGPLATQQLGDLGAEVIVVEARRGDTNRYMGPGPLPGMSGVSMNIMRNKHSICIDLKTEAGRSAFLRLAETVDVIITNLRPGPLGRLRLTYQDVCEVNPNLVFCQAHGYPSSGNQANDPAYDDIIQSASGVGDLFRRQGFEPSLLPTLVADKVSGHAIANAVLAALYHRATTGQGQQIEVPMIDVMRAFVLVEHTAGATPEPPLDSPGYKRILTANRRPQPTADGWINVLPYTKDHYQSLFAIAGREHLNDDPRIASAQSRIANSDSLYAEVATIWPDRTTEEWLEICRQHGIPAAKAATLDDLVDELPVYEHPQAGAYRIVPPPVVFSATPANVHRHAPTTGQDTRTVLADLGYSDEELDDLATRGVIFHPES